MTIGQITFGAPLLLLGLLGAAIPILLHFIWRMRAAQLQFSTLRFLQAAMIRSARRRKLENIAVLAMRCSLVGLIACAVGLPAYHSSGTSLTSSGAGVVIILDNSMSMALQVKGRPTFNRAKLAAINILPGFGQVAAPQQAAVILTCAAADKRTVPLTTDLARLAQTIRSATVSDGRADLAACLARACRMLINSTVTNKFVYLLTDLQANSTDINKLRQISDDFAQVRLMLLNFAGQGVYNVALENLQTPLPAVAGMEVQIRAQVRNYCPVGQQVTVQLHLGDTPVAGAARRITLAPAGSTGQMRKLSFSTPVDPTGTIWGHISIKAKQDQLPRDDRAYFAGRVLTPVPVGLVEQAREIGSPQRSTEPGFYLATALDLAEAVDLDRLAPAELLAGDLGKYRTIFLVGGTEIDDAEAAALNNWLANNKLVTLVVFAQRDKPGEDLCNLLGTFGLECKISPPGNTGPLKAVAALPQHPFLASLGFKPDAYQNLVVQTYSKLALPDRQAADIILALENGDPLILQGPVGEGKVIVLTIPPEPENSNLPLLPIFPAMMAQICLDSVEHDSWQIFRAGEQPTAGRSESAEKHRALDTYVAGVFHQQAGNQGESADVFAVNPAPGESDLAAIESDKLTGAIDRCLGADSLEQLSEQMAQLQAGKPMWDYLLAVALIIMIAETALANRAKPQRLT